MAYPFFRSRYLQERPPPMSLPLLQEPVLINKETPCSLVISDEGDLSDASPPLITRERHTESQDMVICNEPKESLQDKSKLLIWKAKVYCHAHMKLQL